MGNFYVNQTVKCAGAAPLAAFLRDYQAFISPMRGGATVVYERRADLQDTAWTQALSDALSNIAGGAVLNVLNHDDDILYYSLHEGGRMIDEYDSAPGYFDGSGGGAPKGGDAARLCQAFGTGDVAAVEAALRPPLGGYTFEIDRHDALVKALGVTRFAVGFGWGYLSEGEFPDGLGRADFIELNGSAAYKGFSFPY